jgi:hypothetical protein
MSKRSAQFDAADSPAAKHARVDSNGGGSAGGGLNSASSSGSEPDGPPSPSLRSAAERIDHLRWSMRREVHALKLRALMRSSDMCACGQSRAVIELLKEDAARAFPLVDLGYVAEVSHHRRRLTNELVDV